MRTLRTWAMLNIFWTTFHGVQSLKKNNMWLRVLDFWWRWIGSAVAGQKRIRRSNQYESHYDNLIQARQLIDSAFQRSWNNFCIIIIGWALGSFYLRSGVLKKLWQSCEILVTSSFRTFRQRASWIIYERDQKDFIEFFFWLICQGKKNSQ